jgi:hypothetical protein
MARVGQRGNERITYERQGQTWIVASGYHGDRIFYRKAMLACGGCINLPLNIPQWTSAPSISS